MKRSRQQSISESYNHNYSYKYNNKLELIKCPPEQLYWSVHIYGSGSDGNATMIRFPSIVRYTILLDCGLYGLHKRFKEINEYDRKYDRLIILITHTHSDHMKGVSAFLKANKKENLFQDVSVWCSEESYPKMISKVPKEFYSKVHSFKYGEYFVKNKYFGICGFEADHDEPGSSHYHILSLQCQIVYGSDTNTLSDEFLYRAKHYSHITFLESNYDEEWMRLDKNPITNEPNVVIYNDEVKERIISRGHCSNQYIKMLSDEHKLDLSRVCLMHLSKCYNSNEVVSKRLGEVLIGFDRSAKDPKDVLLKILPDGGGIIKCTE